MDNQKINNDIKVSINRLDNNETLINGDFLSVVNVSLNSAGEMATSFFGIYNESIFKSMEKEVKKYFKTLKKSLKKNPPLEEVDITLKEEDLPEENKLNDHNEKTYLKTSTKDKKIKTPNSGNNAAKKENKDIHNKKENVNKQKTKK